MARIDKVGFVGLGIMGAPMARNLREAGFELSVYTRTREKADRFAAEHGARPLFDAMGDRKSVV